MSRLGWVLIGILLTIGAVSLGGYRHVYEPSKRVKATAPAERSVSSSRPSVTTAPSAPSSQARTSSAPATTTTASAASFDTIVNVLNVVVGIAGIWMTIAGMRMQRQAMEITAGRRQG